MFHPLLGDPGKIKDAELESKIVDLGKKYQIAARMGHGAVCDQMLMILEILRTEQQRRSQAAMQAAITKQNGKGLDELINVD